MSVPIDACRGAWSRGRATCTLGGGSRGLYQHMRTLHMHTKAPEEKAVHAAAAAEDPDKDEDKDLAEMKKKSYKEQFSIMWKKYSMVFVGTYVGIYLSTLSGMFFCVENDVFPAAALGVDPIETVKSLGRFVDRLADSDSCSSYIHAHPWVGTFIVSWALTKPTEPLRFVAAAAITPSVARALGQRAGRIEAKAEAEAGAAAAAEAKGEGEGEGEEKKKTSVLPARDPDPKWK